MKSQSYNIFWQRIHKSAREKVFPLRVMFELTYRCNFYCKYCYVPQSYRDYNELKTKEVFSILDQLKDIGCFYLGFTGGEPFLRKDIMEILWYAKRNGFEVIIYTNGSLIDEKTAEELAHLRPNKVDITIPAMSKTVFERITGIAGSRDRIFGAIDLLYKNGVNLGFKTCVLKENENEIKDIQDFAASLGAMHRLDDMLSPCLDGAKEPYKYRGKLHVARNTSYVKGLSPQILNKTETKGTVPDRKCNTLHITRNTYDVVPDTCDKRNSYQLPINQLTNHQELFKCGVGVSQAAITTFGELKMCLMIDYPKYKILTQNRLSVSGNRFSVITANRKSQTANRNHRVDLKTAWERLKELVASIKPDKGYKCNRCELEPYCKWCPARGWLYNRSFTSCETESRRWAKRGSC